jgi:hypothetical protein
MRLVLLSVLAAFGLSGCLYGVPQDGYGYGGPDPYGYPGDQYPGSLDGYGGYGARQVRCESNDDRTRRCPMDTSGGVQIARRLSDAPCVRGRSWDYDRGSGWVSRGCRAEFVSGYGRDPYGGGYDGGSGYGATFRCESGDMRLRRCPADTRSGVVLVRQLSDSRCIQGQTWGWDARGVWVDRGCRGEFRIGGGRYGDNGGGGYPGYGYGNRTLRCESTDNRPRRCDTPIRGARLQRQLSDTRCIEGRTWGWDPRGIWVSAGCRGEFVVW